jgi:hypothetical protein
MDLAKGMFYFFLIGFIIMIANSISIYHLEFSQRKILNISVSEKKLFSKAVKLFEQPFTLINQTLLFLKNIFFTIPPIYFVLIIKRGKLRILQWNNVKIFARPVIFQENIHSQKL